MNPASSPGPLPVQLGKLTRREFRERMASGELRLAILPVAAVEQHLEHLAMEHDWRSATLIAAQVAERLFPAALTAEALLAGVSEHHMRHAGTLTLSPGVFLAVLNDLVDSLVRAGFRHLLILNGHGGNVVPVASTLDQFLRRFQINLQFLSYWDVLTEADAKELLMSGHRLPEDLPGHAQEFETSIALAAFPENVRSAALSGQPDQTPAVADAARGSLLLERIVERVTQFARQMLDNERVAVLPPFHP
ncbi:MAG TPA: creatininase family protein [Verrucomicrobiales bacterium]|nr:creatininase family protein [Verrucomicrobiales bacterium]